MADRLASPADLPAPAAADRPRLREIRPGSILQVAAWPGSARAVEMVLAEWLGMPAPLSGRAAMTGEVTVAAIAPGRWLVATGAAGEAGRFEAALPADQGTVADLSHGRVILRLEGRDAATLLGKCVAIDLHRTTFPPGRAAQTAIHHIDVLVHRPSEESFDLWVLRGFAESLAEWMLDAGAELGVEMRL